MVHCVRHTGSISEIETSRYSQFYVPIELISFSFPTPHSWWSVACMSKAFSIDVLLPDISYSYFCSFGWLRCNSPKIRSSVFFIVIFTKLCNHHYYLILNIFVLLFLHTHSEVSVTHKCCFQD